MADVFFDPRAPVPVGVDGRAVMHAKCLVVDRLNGHFKSRHTRTGKKPPYKRGVPGQVLMPYPACCVDRRWVFATTANFADAGHNRNVEVGLHAERPLLAYALAGAYNRLIMAGAFRGLAIPSTSSIEGHLP